MTKFRSLDVEKLTLRKGNQEKEIDYDNYSTGGGSTTGYTGEIYDITTNYTHTYVNGILTSYVYNWNYEGILTPETYYYDDDKGTPLTGIGYNIEQSGGTLTPEEEIIEKLEWTIKDGEEKMNLTFPKLDNKTLINIKIGDTEYTKSEFDTLLENPFTSDVDISIKIYWVDGK